MKTLVYLLVLVSLSLSLFSQTEYKNEQYGFSVTTPDTWRVEAEFKHIPDEKRGLVVWALPGVYSELEKETIENAISITAYKRDDIKNIQDVLNLELDRLSFMLESREVIPKSLYPSVIANTKRGGNKYKSKVSVMYKNGIGYVFCYTATPGTYDLNVEKYDDFLQRLKLYEPTQSLDSNSIERFHLKFNGFYIAEKGKMKINGKATQIYTYLKFDEDGTVYKQDVSVRDPQKVAKWFPIDNHFERKGTYQIKGFDIYFKTNNKESKDFELEGPVTEIFQGKMTDENKLYLEVFYDNGESADYWFEFVEIE